MLNMGREIRFRAWNPKKEIMHYENVGFTSGKFGIEIPNYDYPEVYVGDELVGMEWTGMKDKNGKEIWEGDIVKFYFGEFESPKNLVSLIFEPARPAGFDHENATEMIDEVIFKDGCFYAWSHDVDGGRFLHNTNENCEVIGNIYESPELLK